MENSSHRKVLIIDDNLEWSELLCTAFKDQYEVFAAFDGQEGLEIAEREAPDLILCDIMMPRITGAEVLRQLYNDARLNRVQVIMMTANQMDAATQSLFKEHPIVRGFLRKPCALQDVLKTVRYVLNTPNTRALATPSRPVAASKATKEKKSYKVLVIDDDPAFFQFLNLVIHRDDQVFRALDGTQAMEQLKLVTPHLIILDIMMPHMSGVEFLRTIQRSASWAVLPVVVLTAVHMTPKNIELLRQEFPNVRYIIEKPCDITPLRNILDSILLRDLVQ